MSIPIKVSTKGQLVLPVEIRRRFKINPGDTLLAEVTGNSLQLRQEPKPFSHTHGVIAAAFNSWQASELSGAEFVRSLRDADRLSDEKGQ
jgi:AbrB family looped-hinge helix DNA binding protein